MFTPLDINMLLQDISYDEDKIEFENKYRLDKEELKELRLKHHYSKMGHNSYIVHHKTTLRQYKSLHKLIKNRAKYLDCLIQYGKDTRVNDYATVHNNYYFYVSNRHLAKIYKGTVSTWNRNINLFIVLGLLNRINDLALEVANSHILNESMKYNKRKAKQLGVDPEQIKMIGYYSIPLFDDELLSKADEIAKKMIDGNFRANAFSKTFLIKIFGQDFADNVFEDTRCITDYSDYVKMQIENFILSDIKENGYTTKNRIIDCTEIKNNGSRKNILTVEFDRSIRGICDGYSLEYRKANKELKEKFSLDGYKTIIFKL